MADYIEKIRVSDGQGGTVDKQIDYNGSANKPKINNVELSGNKTASDLGLGTYSKPSGGIPKTDLASDVQTSLGNNRKPKLVAHAGLGNFFPENTLYGLQGAKVYGFELAEFDIRPTSDYEYICMHDPTIDRTTDGTGTVEQMTVAQIKATKIARVPTDNYSGFDPSTMTLRVPTLDELLDYAIAIDINLIIENHIDNLPANYGKTKQEMLDILLNKIKAHNAEDRVIIADFDPAFTNLPYLRSQSSRLKLALVQSAGNKSIFLAGVDKCHQYNLIYDASRTGYTALTTDLPELVEYARTKDVQLGFWTIDLYYQLRDLVEYGVDYMTTNQVVNWNSVDGYISEYKKLPDNGGVDVFFTTLQKGDIVEVTGLLKATNDNYQFGVAGRVCKEFVNAVLNEWVPFSVKVVSAIDITQTWSHINTNGYTSLKNAVAKVIKVNTTIPS